jgi:hypothetical protein
MSTEILCSGPGPHDPVSGVLGSTTGTAPAGLRCGSPACQPPPDPLAVNAAAVATALHDAIPAMRQAKVNADVNKTAGQNAKASAQAVKDLPVTTVAEARTAVRALADAVIALSNSVIDGARLDKDIAATALRLARQTLAEFDGTD